MSSPRPILENPVYAGERIERIMAVDKERGKMKKFKKLLGLRSKVKSKKKADSSAELNCGYMDEIRASLNKIDKKYTSETSIESTSTSLQHLEAKNFNREGSFVWSRTRLEFDSTTPHSSPARNLSVFSPSRFVLDLFGKYIYTSCQDVLKLPSNVQLPSEWSKLYKAVVLMLLSFAKQRNYDFSETRLILRERAYLDSILEDFSPSGFKYASKIYSGVRCDVMTSKKTKKHDFDKHYDLLLYAHGGTFVSMKPERFRPLLSGIAGYSQMIRTIITPDYRLSPEYQYPAALDDLMAVYQHILQVLKYHPHQIVLAGDSAGGCLSLALLLKLKDSNLPLPLCCLLLSPWTNLDYESQIYFDQSGNIEIIKPWDECANELLTYKASGSYVMLAKRGNSFPAESHPFSESGNFEDTSEKELCDLLENFETVKIEETQSLRSVPASNSNSVSITTSDSNHNLDISTSIQNEITQSSQKHSSVVFKTNTDPNNQKWISIHPGDIIRYTYPSVNENFGKDVVDPRFDRLCAVSYIGNEDPQNPYVSPFYGSFGGLPPILIHCGDMEVTRDEIIELSQNLIQAGVTVSFNCFPNEVHDFQTFPDAPHRKESLKLMGAFIEMARELSFKSISTQPLITKLTNPSALNE